VNVQNALKGGFRLSQKGYSFTSLQGFSNTVKCIGRDVEGSDATDVVFSMRGVFSDGVGLDTGRGTGVGFAGMGAVTGSWGRVRVRDW